MSDTAQRCITLRIHLLNHRFLDRNHQQHRKYKQSNLQDNALITLVKPKEMQDEFHQARSGQYHIRPEIAVNALICICVCR